MNEPAIIVQSRMVASVRVVGIPKGQPRPRAFVRPGSGRAGVFDPGTAEGWKGDVARAFSVHEGQGLAGALEARLTFFLPRPKSHFRKCGRLAPKAPRFLYTKKPDADNLAKAVLDALTGIRVWMDDDQVTDLIILKRWEIPGEEAAGCMVRISELREVTV